MTREQLLQHVVHQARRGGFELRRWFHADAAIPWPGNGDAAVQWLAAGRRVHLLLFSHSFAQAFFAGSEDGLRHIQPAITFRRTAPNGITRTVHRRAHTRNTRHPGAWRYHLQHMALAPDPLLYAHRFVISTESLAGKPRFLVPPKPPAPPPPDYDDELLVRDNEADIPLES